MLIAIHAQDINYAHQVIDTLAYPSMHGRGYVEDGIKIAEKYIANEFKKHGLKPIKGSDYSQKLSYTINTFPGKMIVKIDDKELIPGKDFMVDPSSGGGKGSYELFFINKQTFEMPDKERKFSETNFSKLAAAVDQKGLETKIDKQKFDSFSKT